MLSPGAPKDEHLSCWQEGEFQQRLLKAELCFLPAKPGLSKREDKLLFSKHGECLVTITRREGDCFPLYYVPIQGFCLPF